MTTMQAATAEYFTPRELAARFKLSVRTVQYLIDRGALNAIRIGHSLRVPADELARYERENMTGRGQ